jgi:hypothetical protein
VSLHSSESTRIRFGVINLPIRRALRCGPFLLEPIEDIKEALERLKAFEPGPEITAVGTFALQNVDSLDKAWNQFWQPVGALELLLTFAHRCHIQIVEPVIEVRTDIGWNETGWHIYWIRHGSAKASPWYITQSELEEFLARSYPKLLEPGISDEQGLRLALTFYGQIFADIVAEVQFLNTWLAFEILYSANIERTKLLSKKIFAAVRRRIDSVLNDGLADGLLQQSQLDALKSKISALNQTGVTQQVHKFLQKTFASYPAQEVTSEELARFYQIRNEIMHGGSMRTYEKDYVQELHEEQMRLKALLERIVLGMLGERPNLMEFSWREWRSGR